MAFLADSGVPRPPSSTRLDLPFNRGDWLLVVAFAVFLATILVLQGSLASQGRSDFSATAVCERPPNFFFLAVH